MQLIFGWHLDGLTYPETVDGSIAAIDSAVVGPLGFLDILETHLGLGGRSASSSVRIAQYLARLQHIDDGQLFFSKSFKEDPWGVAARLLDMRDTLILHSWTAQSPGHYSRLQCFAKLESLSNSPLSPGLNDRLTQVRQHLLQRKKLPLESIRVITPQKHLPQPWQQLLHLLQESGVALSEQQLQPKAKQGDLLSVQKFLANPAEKSKITSDKSFTVLESDDEIQASEATAAWLAADESDNKNLIIIRGHSTHLLDQACHAIGLPGVGGDSSSRWRSALQVLPLYFELLFEPLNPMRLLEFLTLPGSPVSRSVAHMFARALENEPGTGGSAWQQAWQNAAQARRDKFINDGMCAADADNKVKSDIQTWKQWLEPQRFDATSGLPAKEALRVCKMVKDWALRKHAVSEGNSLFQAAALQAAALSETIDATALSTLSKIQLDRIIDYVVGEGFKQPGITADAAPWYLVDRPGQVWGPAPRILWWGFIGTGHPAAGPTWNHTERKFLSDQGIELESETIGLIREAYSWRYPIMNAHSSVLLVKPRMVAGEHAPAHPLWHEMSELVPKQQVTVIRQADEIYSSKSVQLADRDLQRTAVKPLLVPSPRRLWTVPAKLLTPRLKQSPSSTEKLIGCPLAWVLMYKARLNSGLSALPNDAQLIGTLAHKAMADLFAERIKWKPDEASQRFISLFEKAVSEMGTQLTLPGKRLEMERAKNALSSSVANLIDLINNAKLTVVGNEVLCNKAFEGGEFEGRIDIVLKAPSGKRVVLDYKWTSMDKYKRESLQQGTALQLAAYSWLLSDSSDKDPSAGYFMLKQGRLFHSEQAHFPDYTYVDGSHMPDVWKATVSAHKVRMKELTSGQIVAAGIPDEQNETTAGTPTMEIEAPCKFCDYGLICGRSVTENEQR